MVLSHAFWKRTFGEDTDVVGRDILLNGARFQVVGVSREGFRGAAVGVSPDVFVPIVMFRTFNPTANNWNTRGTWFLTVMGRLKPEVTRAQAEAELGVLWQQILNNDPNRRPVATWDKQYTLNNTALVLPGNKGYSYLRNETSRPLIILMITVGLVLLIACANVANLLLARAVGRSKEIAVRLAVGAGRGRLMAQMLTESITLSVLGGMAGVAGAWIGVRVLMSFLPQRTFSVELYLSPDPRLLSFACGVICGEWVDRRACPGVQGEPARLGICFEVRCRQPYRWSVEALGLASYSGLFASGAVTAVAGGCRPVCPNVVKPPASGSRHESRKPAPGGYQYRAARLSAAAGTYVLRPATRRGGAVAGG